MAKKLNGSIIILKGLIDIISDGETICLINIQGGLKRCGG
jgi:NAD(P)H-hydrate repair Nnr-like enzyme with NAD(P)H-hydrate dehydratase domain